MVNLARKDDVREARSFCGDGDCPCAVNDPAGPCKEWCDPAGYAPPEPFHTRCARCGHARWKHANKGEDAVVDDPKARALADAAFADPEIRAMFEEAMDRTMREAPVPDNPDEINRRLVAITADVLRVGAFERVMDALKAAAMAGGGEVAMSPAEVAVLAVDAVLGPDE